MILHDKAGTTYYDKDEAMQRLGIKATVTLLKLIKRHQIKRYGFYPSRKVWYKQEDIEYLATEETADFYERPPLVTKSYRPETGPMVALSSSL
jgi:hypothetical protein